MMRGSASPTVEVEHPWPLRTLRTLQFGLARLVSGDGYVEARARPFDLVFTGLAADVITRHIYRLGVHEPAITRYLLQSVRLAPGEVALDVGANLGWYSLLLSRLSAPGAEIFAFEPDPKCFELLRRNLARNGATGVQALNVALGERGGMAVLHRYKASNCGRHTLLEGSTSGDTVEVPVMTLESFWRERGLGERRVSLLKIDVEGFEYFVLRGAGEVLGRCRRIVLEYSPQSLKLAGLAAGKLTGLLGRFRLRAHRFAGRALVPVTFAQLEGAAEQWDLLLTPDCQPTIDSVARQWDVSFASLSS
jgi:FkbM family methyltransferase